jgi:hypothetical protein
MAAAFLLSLSAGIVPAVAESSSLATQIPFMRLPLTTTPTLPADGLYEAGDAMFMISHLAGQVRLRFVGSDEIFYLTSERASMGGRVLKYDSGEVALLVAGWGGVTLYTEDARTGVPAELSDANAPFDPKPVAAKDFLPYVSKLAQDMAAHDNLAVGFAADWDVLQKSDKERALACDAMRAAAAGILRAVKYTKKGALADGLHIVKVAPAQRPGVTVNGGVVIVSYNTSGGPSARPSSRLIARALEQAF